MASSGSFTTNEYKGRSIKFSWWINSQDVASNKTNIGWKIEGAGSYTGWIYTTNFSVTINGINVFASSSRPKLKQGMLIKIGSTNIYHNNDGTKTFSASCSGAVYYYSANVSGSKSWSLTTIPRKSSVGISSSTVTMGNSINISINRASSSFTHTLTYKFGSATGTIGTNVATSKSWSVPLSLANQIPSSTSGVGTIYCYTYSGGTHIGTSSVNFTAVVPPNIVPSFESLTLQRVDNTVPPDWELYVKTKSACVATINGATGSYGSTISSYLITGGGYSSTSNTLTTGILNNAGTVTFTAKITDSRGRTATQTQSITVVDYSGPNIQGVLTQRCFQDGTLNNDGTYAKCNATISHSACNDKNTLTKKVSIRKSGEENWSSETPLTNGAVIGDSNIDVDYSYDIKYEVSDKFTTVTFIDLVSTAFTTVDYRKGGKGVAFGKVSEKDCFECAMDAEFTGKVKMGEGNIGLLAYPIGAVFISFDNTSPKDLFGGTWERIVNRFLWCQDDGVASGRTGGISRVTLTKNQLANHKHTHYSHSHSTSCNTTGNHTHVGRFKGFGSVTSSTSGYYMARRIINGDSYDTTCTFTGGAGNHKHNVTVNANTTSEHHVGENESHENMPPWMSVNAWKRIA